jgi:hypothetical protein
MYNNRYSCQILMKQSFSTNFKKIFKLSNFLTISLVGAEEFHAEGRTDGRT